MKNSRPLLLPPSQALEAASSAALQEALSGLSSRALSALRQAAQEIQALRGLDKFWAQRALTAAQEALVAPAVPSPYPTRPEALAGLSDILRPLDYRPQAPSYVRPPATRTVRAPRTTTALTAPKGRATPKTTRIRTRVRRPVALVGIPRALRMEGLVPSQASILRIRMDASMREARAKTMARRRATLSAHRARVMQALLSAVVPSPEASC